jgi:hypothetical protein
MVCGGDFNSHLELWWSKHLYSPFDQYLDRTYENALTISEGKHSTNRNHNNYKSSNKTRGSGSRGSNNKQSSDPEVTGTPSFAFHKRYVQDVSDIVDNVQERKEQLRLMKTRLTASKPDQAYQMVRVPATGVTYVAPGAVKGSSYNRKAALVDLLRTLILGSVDDMIYVQGIENKKLSAPKSIRERL